MAWLTFECGPRILLNRSPFQSADSRGLWGASCSCCSYLHRRCHRRNTGSSTVDLERGVGKQESFQALAELYGIVGSAYRKTVELARKDVKQILGGQRNMCGLLLGPGFVGAGDNCGLPVGSWGCHGFMDN